MSLKTNRIEFLTSGLLFLYGNLKIAVCGQYLDHDRGTQKPCIFCISTSCAHKKDESSITQNGHHVFVFSGDEQGRVVVKYNWSSTQILQVLWIKYNLYKYKYFALPAIMYSSTSSTDTSSTSTSTSTSTNTYFNPDIIMFT